MAWVKELYSEQAKGWPKEGLVLKNGLKVNKLGGYDGHLTNSDAFADDSLENTIYR